MNGLKVVMSGLVRCIRVWRINIMKVKKLIELLSQMNPELLVVVAGYEGGVDEMDKFEMCDIELNVNTEWYYGKHEILAEGDNPTNKDSTIVRGVRLIGDWS